MDEKYISPTYGELSADMVREKIIGFMKKDSERKYRMVIGTDSQNKNGSGVDFITAIIIHRIGEGGIYFYKRIIKNEKIFLRNRIYQEASLSLACAEETLEIFKGSGLTKYDIEIHVDIGPNGETRGMLSEIMGMVRASGYIVRTKPDSFGASKVADRHT